MRASSSTTSSPPPAAAAPAAPAAAPRSNRASTTPTDQAGAGRLLLVAPHNSYRIPAYVRAAQGLGAAVVLASHTRHSLVSELAEGIDVDLADVDTAAETLLAAAAQRPFDAVIGTDDQALELAARVARALGLPHNEPGAARISHRKDLARARLAAAGLPVPGYRVVDLDRPLRSQLAGLSFPCVVKPLVLAASRGVIRADDRDALEAACARVEAILADADHAPGAMRRRVLVEDYIPGGVEVALEGLLVDGTLETLAVFDKPDPLEGPYFEETYYTTPSRLPAATAQRVRARVAEACAAYGLRHGPVHAELRIHDGEAWILEVAARTIGGHCGRLLRFGTGYGLEELVVANALGRRLPAAGESGGAGVLMIPTPRRGILRRVEGIGAARRVPGIEAVEISLREGYELVPLPEGQSYLGFIFARAPTPERAEQALREAHAQLNIVTAPVFHLRSGE